MIAESVLSAIDLNCNSMDGSPSRKRARYESPVKDRWSLTQNNILLDEVYDCGVALLVDSDSECGSEEDRDNGSRNDREQMAVLQATISKETLRRMTQQEWESLID